MLQNIQLSSTRCEPPKSVESDLSGDNTISSSLTYGTIKQVAAPEELAQFHQEATITSFEPIVLENDRVLKNKPDSIKAVQTGSLTPLEVQQRVSFAQCIRSSNTEVPALGNYVMQPELVYLIHQTHDEHYPFLFDMISSNITDEEILEINILPTLSTNVRELSHHELIEWCWEKGYFNETEQSTENFALLNGCSSLAEENQVVGMEQENREACLATEDEQRIYILPENKVPKTKKTLKGLALIIEESSPSERAKKFSPAIASFMGSYPPKACLVPHKFLEMQNIHDRIKQACVDANFHLTDVSEQVAEGAHFIKRLSPKIGQQCLQRLYISEIAAIAVVCCCRPQWLMTGEGTAIDTNAIPNPYNGYIALEQLPQRQIRNYLRTKKSIYLPNYIQTFLNKNYTEFHIKLSTERTVITPSTKEMFILHLNKRQQELNLSDRQLSLLVDPRKEHLISAMRRTDSVSIIDFTALCLVLGCSPQWLLGEIQYEGGFGVNPPVYYDVKKINPEVLQDNVRGHFLVAGIEDLHEKSSAYDAEFEALLCSEEFVQFFDKEPVVGAYDINKFQQVLETCSKFTSYDTSQKALWIRRAIKLVVQDITLGKRFTPYQVNAIAKCLGIKVMPMLNGEIVPKHSILQHSVQHQSLQLLQSLYCQNFVHSILAQMMSASLFEDPTLPNCIKQKLNQTCCLNEVLSENGKDISPIFGRIETQCRVLGIDQVKLNRMLTLNPSVRVKDHRQGRANLPLAELCGYAFILGVRPDWLMNGEGDPIESGQIPYFVKLPDQKQAKQTLLSHIDDYLAGNQQVMLSTDVMVTLFKYYNKNGVVRPNCSEVAVSHKLGVDKFEHFKTRLEREISEQDLTQALVSLVVFGDNKALYRQLNDRKSINYKQVAALAQGLNLRIDWLVMGEKPIKMNENDSSLLVNMYKKKEVSYTQPELKMVKEHVTKCLKHDKRPDSIFSELCMDIWNKDKMDLSEVTKRANEKIHFTGLEQKNVFLHRVMLAANAIGFHEAAISTACTGKQDYFILLKRGNGQGFIKNTYRRKELLILSLALGVRPNWLLNEEDHLVCFEGQMPWLYKVPGFAIPPQGESRVPERLMRKRIEQIQEKTEMPKQSKKRVRKANEVDSEFEVDGFSVSKRGRYSVRSRKN
ncbi:hypothetical protein D5R81_16120 [Parashewanella spongiae]|uniref:Uncharacterized protein n=1 Tax=Parashewanella spongiae TaxID=342950 RepID=A0A3A6TF25_9GAMM|nr:hypothetical protein [Parashewanella spongiae]MCL1079567.1 hypothetical protein [Parashewanella spongiae]RJY07290.1 hypothetical protein D5R81_16120 [Parashewanella spongiae]